MGIEDVRPSIALTKPPASASAPWLRAAMPERTTSICGTYCKNATASWSPGPACAASCSRCGLLRSRNASGPSIGGAANAMPRRGCWCRLMAALTTGWASADHGCTCWPPLMTRLAKCWPPSFASRRTVLATFNWCSSCSRATGGRSHSIMIGMRSSRNGRQSKKATPWRSNWQGEWLPANSAACSQSWRSPRSRRALHRPKGVSSGSSGHCKIGWCWNCAWREPARASRPMLFLEPYLPRFNAQFGVPAAQEGTAYRPLPPGLKLDDLMCFKYERVVAADNTVQFGPQRIQVLAGPQRRSYARATVAVHEYFDGSLAIYSAGQRLASTEAPLEAPSLRARGGRLRLPAPASAQSEQQAEAGSLVEKQTPGSTLRDDHPWRKWTGPPDQTKQADPF